MWNNGVGAAHGYDYEQEQPTWGEWRTLPI